MNLDFTSGSFFDDSDSANNQSSESSNVSMMSLMDLVGHSPIKSMSIIVLIRFVLLYYYQEYLKEIQFFRESLLLQKNKKYWNII